MAVEKRNAPLPARNDAPDTKGNKSKHKINSNGESISMCEYNPTRNKFQYKCSFCWRELPSDGLRFAGFGACPPHLKLAEFLVDALRGHRARYFNSDFTEAK